MERISSKNRIFIYISIASLLLIGIKLYKFKNEPLVFSSYKDKGVPPYFFDPTQEDSGKVELISSDELHEKQFDETVSSSNVSALSLKYLIHTPGCKLPRLNINYPGYMRMPSYKPDCEPARVISKIKDDRQILKLNREFKDYDCTVSEIKRANDSDSKFTLTDPQRISTTLKIHNKELLLTRCGDYQNLDANFPIKPEIKAKIKYWKNKEDLPINVLFFGFDTTSRAHFHRSLPGTMKKFKEMGFIDFKGYHSVAPYTLENFLAFLFGMTTPEIRRTCAPNRKSSFHTCPGIWKDFDLNQFVTLYAEDGTQSFNWGGQGGFKHRPTDYYTHPLFLARSLRKKVSNLSKVLPPVDDNCVNHLNPQTWLLNYLRRFYKKFSKTKVPFFAFQWNNDATHDSENTLAGMDEDIMELLKALEASPQTLERTMVLMVSDHGARYGDVTNIARVGAFLERSLPGLFIRVPEMLSQKYPEVVDLLAINQNTRRLTTGFDIHHTFKHLLALQGLKLANMTSTADFKPVQRDRSSLFLPISGDRSCPDVNIMMGCCVCNSSAETPAWDNPYIRHKLIRFAFEELNGFLNHSKYYSRCEQYEPPMMTFVSAAVIKTTGSYTEGIMRFIASPKAIFEVRLEVEEQSNNKSEIRRVTRVGSFTRIDPYKNKSWCIEFDTDDDHMFKEICTCK